MRAHATVVHSPLLCGETLADMVVRVACEVRDEIHSVREPSREAVDGGRTPIVSVLVGDRAYGDDGDRILTGGVSRLDREVDTIAERVTEGFDDQPVLVHERFAGIGGRLTRRT